MRHNNFARFFTTAWAIAATSFLPLSNSVAATVVVSPSNMGNWIFNLTDNTGTPGGSATGQMVTGPATPPLGTGSANFITSPGNGDERRTAAQSRLGGHKGRRSDKPELQHLCLRLERPATPFVNLYLDTTGGSPPTTIAYGLSRPSACRRGQWRSVAAA